MKTLKDKLSQKLREIFQFESQDLDFGIYRIMNYKRKEIEKFIEKELIEEIKKQLQLLGEEERKEIEEKLREMSSKNGVKKYIESLEKGDEQRARIYKEDFEDQIEKYEILKKQLEDIKISEDLEKQIYNHLINFFSRYYEGGDFISKRRYGRNEKYVIPYNGEEVNLYWANKDQYYIKTTEYFRKYVFKTLKGDIKVIFRVIEAEEEKGNGKSQDKNFFVLNEKVFDFDKDKRELNIYFEYRALTDEEKKKYKQENSVSQDKANEETVKSLDEKIPQNSLARLIFEKQGEKTLIKKHLYRYTRRNTTDYFIHKDLKGFLERELDFYIKNEFLQLDDLQVLEQSGYFDKLRLYLIGVRAFRNIALKIIEFLAQIENFQKKLWEKKKFVIDTQYVITLDKINEYADEDFLDSILDEVLKNEKQLEEWKELFNIDVKNKEDLILNNSELELNGKEWKKLPVDTKYFDEEFKWKLLVALSKENDLDDILDGVLIKSENWQALNLLLNKYYEKVQTIYIDPPYNTGNNDFIYKDNYKHSSWLTMMENRLSLARELMKDTGVIFVSIDDNELYQLKLLKDKIFGEENFVANIIRITGSTRNMSVNIDVRHDYVLTYAKNKNLVKINGLERTNVNEFINHDDDSTGAWSTQDLTVRTGGYEYEIPSIDGRNSFIRKWRFNMNKMKEVMGGRSEQKFLEIYKEKAQKIKVNNKDWFVVGKIVFKGKSNIPNLKKYLKDVTEITVHTLWNDIESQKKANEELYTFFDNKKVFNNSKPIMLIKKICTISTYNNDIILDFFAGSGTSAHAVMRLNKEDGGKRKFILVEMADYFDTVIIPRIKKVAYSFKWKEGKPQNTDGIGVFFKYHTLEQYEDALENIEFDDIMGKKASELFDEYIFYMLDWETKDSNTFLNLEQLKSPFEYKLKIIDNYQQKNVNIDLIETFNYLLGLRVKGYRLLEDNNRKYVFVFGEKQGKRIAIIWRSVKDIDFERDRQIIEREIKNFNPDEIYINGDAIVKDFNAIEPLFKSLMFD